MLVASWNTTKGLASVFVEDDASLTVDYAGSIQRNVYFLPIGKSLKEKGYECKLGGVAVKKEHYDQINRVKHEVGMELRAKREAKEERLRPLWQKWRAEVEEEMKQYEHFSYEQIRPICLGFWQTWNKIYQNSSLDIKEDEGMHKAALRRDEADALEKQRWHELEVARKAIPVIDPEYHERMRPIRRSSIAGYFDDDGED